MDRFDDLQTFVLVAEKLSIRQAAEQLDRAPSAVSRRIRDLEARLQVQLLNRTTRRIRLTGAGERFLARARQLLADLDEAENLAAEDAQVVSGELRVAMPLSFGIAHLVPAISDFMTEHPSIRFDTDLNDRVVNLFEGRFDLAIRIGTLPDSTLRSRRLAPIHHVVAAAPDFWKEHGIPRTPDRLAGLPALSYSNLSAPHVWSWSNARGRQGQVSLRSRWRASNGEALVQAAIRGLGAVRLPTFMLDRAIRTGELQPVLLTTHWGTAGLYALYPDTAFLPHRTRVFIDYLVARFGDEPVWDECLQSQKKVIARAAPIPGQLL